MRIRGRAWARVAGVLCTAAVAAIYVLNVPFYSGSSLWATASWRMEHGRLSVHWGQAPHRESFYVAPNAEGLRFRPDGRFYSWTSGFVRIPLWMPLTAAAAGTVAVWRKPRRRGVCAACGYSLEGLAAGTCPECGKPAPGAG